MTSGEGMVERVARANYERRQQIAWEGGASPISWDDAAASVRALEMDCGRAAVAVMRGATPSIRAPGEGETGVVERVARAIEAADIDSIGFEPGVFTPMARAAIEAMRLDPSLQSEACPSDIVDAGRNEIMAWDLGPNDFKKANAATVDCFNAMIDAALK